MLDFLFVALLSCYQKCLYGLSHMQTSRQVYRKKTITHGLYQNMMRNGIRQKMMEDDDIYIQVHDMFPDNFQMDQEKAHYDYFVIGGGSGGLASARAAAALGAKVGLADYVVPSPAGTKWGLGGTCVNVGCIPKKMFHFASLLGEHVGDLEGAGWKVGEDNKQNNWDALSERITDHIKSLNFGYRKTLMAENVEYHNKLAKFAGPNTITLTCAQGKVQTVTASKILVATGGRPTYPTDVPGALEHAISSDDIFWMKNKPGKTLIVGASYIALECAGFLHGLGVDVTVMVRSILLRGFDQQLANKIGDYMEAKGIKFIKKSVPVNISKNSKGMKVVTYKQNEEEIEDEFDTVMFAVGRSADTKNLDLDKVGVNTERNGKIIANDDDTTTAENVYAIGDVVSGRLELTPTAIMAGRLLAARLFGKATKLMHYKFVPTTVFTPLEYGCIGYSTEDAIAKFGEENILSYGSRYKPLEWNFDYNRGADVYAKLVVNKADNNRVVGLHYLGPQAGEVTQGFGVAILMGATKQDFDNTVGIHPTNAEEFTILESLVGSSGEEKTGC